MTVLVTGAGGFIGSHLCEGLVARGYDVRALVQYNSMNRKEWLDTIAPDVLAKMDVVSGDIRDLAFMQRVTAGCEGVFHLAALIGIPYSYVNPESYVDTNLTGTLNVLEAARLHGVQKVIHTSTSEVYGSAQFVPITEEHPLRGQSPYSASKIAADQMAYAYACSMDMPVMTIRPFNTFGPRQSLRAVIPTVITQLLRSPDLNIGALSPTRDFSYVGDTVSGFVAAYEAMNKDVIGETFNLGSHFEISIEETIAAIADVLGVTPEITCENERMRPEASEVQRLYADNSKMKAAFDWAPEYEGLEGFKVAISKTIEWYKRGENIAFFNETGYVV